MTYQPTFPNAMQETALTLLGTLSATELSPAMKGFTVLVQGEQLSVPYRVYYAPKKLQTVITSSSGDTRTLALSLGTRHWDGHLREYCVRQLVSIDQPWVAPFIIQLVGEYVIEIVEVIAAALPGINTAQFSEFVRDNPKFMATTRRRMTSYWNCYYRYRFKTLKNYPGFIVLGAIERMVLAA